MSLLKYANDTFPDVPVFKQLSVRHQPEVVSYFLTKLGLVVFLNMTKYDPEHLRKYGKMGMLLLPDNLTDKQKESLVRFTENIPDFDISINYDLTMDTGLLDSKMIQGFKHETPLELLNVYLKRVNEKNSDIKSNIH